MALKRSFIIIRKTNTALNGAKYQKKNILIKIGIETFGLLKYSKAKATYKQQKKTKDAKRRSEIRLHWHCSINDILKLYG